MKRIAVFVDAGYFWVQVCSLSAGSYASRNQVNVHYADLHACMISEIKNQLPDGDLLRIYWYDGPGMNGKTAEHRSIDQLDDFKLRLGTRNGVGQQKGVDGLIIADLISLTQQKAITHALLVSGDSDITPGVIAAQSMGLRVHLLSLGAAAATSPYLAAEVDLKRSWGLVEVQKFATASAPAAQPASRAQVLNPTAVPIHTPPVAPASAPSVPVTAVTATVVPAPAAVPSMQAIAQLAATQISAGPNSALFATLTRGTNPLPREIDGELLSVGRSHFGRSLDEQEKRELRREFRKLL